MMPGWAGEGLSWRRGRRGRPWARARCELFPLCPCVFVSPGVPLPEDLVAEPASAPIRCPHGAFAIPQWTHHFASPQWTHHFERTLGHLAPAPVLSQRPSCLLHRSPVEARARPAAIGNTTAEHHSGHTLSNAHAASSRPLRTPSPLRSQCPRQLPHRPLGGATARPSSSWVRSRGIGERPLRPPPAEWLAGAAPAA